MQKLKELIKLSNLCHFQLFASSIEGNIRHQKLRSCWVVKKVMNRTSPVKFRVFRREILRNYSMNWTQLFRENLNWYALSIFKVFILLASSDSDKHNVNEAKSVNKDSPIEEMRRKGEGKEISPGARFSKLPVIIEPVKLFWFPFQTRVSKGMKIIHLSYQLKKQSGLH